MAVTIFVDADACPVKDEVQTVAERYGLAVVLVANFGLRPSRDPMIRTVTVGDAADAADDWIVEHAAAGDIVITADIGLAGRALEGGALVLGPTGREFDSHSIGMATAMRDLNRHLRETGEGGHFNASFTSRDRSNFLQMLDKLIHKARRQGVETSSK